MIMIFQEAENLRSRYNDVILEKQRLDQEVSSLRRFVCIHVQKLDGQLQ